MYLFVIFTTQSNCFCAEERKSSAFIAHSSPFRNPNDTFRR